MKKIRTNVLKQMLKRMQTDEKRGNNDKEHKQTRNGMERKKKGTLFKHDIYKGREIIAYITYLIEGQRRRN